ncbi:MAG: Spy/CpxP family protein refolding chaperone [Pseudomonadales bacterium]
MRNPVARRVYTAMLVLLMSSVALVATARPNFDPGQMHQRMFDKISKKLDLSEEQTIEVQALREEFQLENGTLHEQIKQKFTAISEQSSSETFDEASVVTLANELGELTAQAAVAVARHHNEFQQLLTAEQREELSQLKAKFSERHANRGDKKGKRGHKRFERMHDKEHQDES